ncbi:MAG: glutamine-hydrolyzing GMP synthase [Candidatus Microgenomates bacterium]
MILIIDFGSQTTHLISRRLKQLGIKNIISHSKNVLEIIKKEKIKGIILSGGPASVYEKNSPTIDKKIFNLNIPILGICYGLQLISQLLEGKVIAGNREYGPEKILIIKKSLLFDGLAEKFIVWMSHGDEVVSLPNNFQTIASTKKVKNAAIENKSKKIFGIQFHPEIYHTQYGQEILKNFCQKICGLKIKENFIEIKSILEKIKTQYEEKKGKIIAAVSGGVDSTVASALIVKTIGEKNFFPIYIDNGLMRYDTKEKVKYIFKHILKTNLKIINAEKIFLKKLKGVINPEKKRKIIGNLYIKLFEKEAKKIKGVSFLMQGTIYSDIVESGQSLGKSQVIKSHHNVGGLPKKMKLTLLEPLKEFYKDEVRQIGRILGLPNEIINTQPFPGPGYAIRIIGEVNKKRLEKIKKIDQILNQILKDEKLSDKVFQSFPILTGIKSTAVKGDNRVYGEVVSLLIYESQDIMSASWAKVPYQVLDKIAQEITKNTSDVSRVVYDITTKPPATMEWE